LNHLLIVGGHHYFERWSKSESVREPFLILFDGCYSDRFFPEFFRNQSHLLRNKVLVCCCDRNSGLFEKILTFLNSIKVFGLGSIEKFLFDKDYYAGCIELPDVCATFNDFEDTGDVVEYKRPEIRVVDEKCYIHKPIKENSPASWLNLEQEK
jgi:hypothetical protein